MITLIGSEYFAAFKNEICQKAITQVLQDQFALKNINIVSFKYSRPRCRRQLNMFLQANFQIFGFSFITYLIQKCFLNTTYYAVCKIISCQFCASIIVSGSCESHSGVSWLAQRLDFEIMHSKAFVLSAAQFIKRR